MENKKLKYFVHDFIENGRDFVVARIVDTQGSAPRKSGAMMILNDHGDFLGTVGGGKIEAVTQEKCREIFDKKPEQSERFHFKLNTKDADALDMGCGGEADVLVEYVRAAAPGEILQYFESTTTAFIFGGGHVALALEPILRHIDFKTVVIDDREEYANPIRYPEAEQTLAVASFPQAFSQLSFDRDSYIVIVTRGHRGDMDVLREALKQDVAYIGMIGSRGKNQMLYDQLRSEGVPQEKLDRVYAPIGEDIHAETPEEIGVSIAAEMICVRSGHGTR